MRPMIAAHYSKIGRRGGRVSSPAKAIAARLNALKRWRPKAEAGILPRELLRDGIWYRGRGRNSSVGLWDSRARCFWTIVINDFADPAHFPRKARRQVRLKREDYFSVKSGTFKPSADV
jgi:hypothetical protein